MSRPALGAERTTTRVLLHQHPSLQVGCTPSFQKARATHAAAEQPLGLRQPGKATECSFPCAQTPRLAVARARGVAVGMPSRARAGAPVEPQRKPHPLRLRLRQPVRESQRELQRVG